MFSPHHPRCDKYTPPPADPRFARFGEAMWKFITKNGGDFCDDELSEDILPLAQASGLCCLIGYDPEIHGEMDADPGVKIWWWGDSFSGPNTPECHNCGRSTRETPHFWICNNCGHRHFRHNVKSVPLADEKLTNENK
jgi:ribosomal protein L32